MRSSSFFFSLLISASLFLNGQAEAPDTLPELPKRGQKAFKEGEYLKYRIHYGIINAGRAELRIKNLEFRENRPVFHVVGTGRSVGMAEVFFRTRDRYESWIDAEALVPWEFVRDVDEGGYIIERHLRFDRYKNTAKDSKLRRDTVFAIPDDAQDMLSAFYYARSIDAKGLRKGDLIPVNIFLDHKVFAFQLKYMGKETVKSKFGKIRCLKFMPTVQEGRVFKEKEGMLLWVSDDENKVPIRLETELVVGSIKMDISDYKNLRHPIRFD